MAIDSSGNLWVPNNSGIVTELVGVAAPVLTPMVACLTKNAAREGLPAVEGEVSALDPARADEFFKCRGRDSNPHGAFASEDFKSFDYSEKLAVSLALFPSNVKLCKFLCKY